jgi:RNA-binding protein 39
MRQGFAYVEMKELGDIPNCLLFNNCVPDFQKFPILVKGSEAEKNVAGKKELVASIGHVDSNPTSGTATGVGGPDARLYIGNIHTAIDEGAMQAVLEPFGILESIKLHRDEGGVSKGFAFIRFMTAESAANCLRSLAGVELVGRALKVGPVIDNKTNPNVIAVAQQIPGAIPSGFQSSMIDSAAFSILDGNPQGGLRMDSQSRLSLMAKLGASAGMAVPSTAAQSAYTMPAATAAAPAVAAPEPSLQPVVPPVSGTPSPCILICNMYDAATETEEGWELDIKEDVMDECKSHGPVEHCLVESRQPGGLVFVRFTETGAAAAAANVLNGRFFAGRMILVTYLDHAHYTELTK